jgi:4-hydroxybenzoate polyprenyltransferase
VATEDITEFYDSILKNKNSIEFLLFSSSVCTFVLLFYYNLYAILFVYLSSFLYKNIKTLDIPLKPFYVSSLWTISTCIIPEYEDPNFLACMSVFLCIFSLTNIADISDYDEDIKYNVSSLPTELGISTTLKICYFSSLLSTISFLNLDYFTNSIYDYIYILSNIMPYITQ